MTDPLIETETDTIARILQEHEVLNSSHVAQRVYSALIARRLTKDLHDLDRRQKLGLT